MQNGRQGASNVLPIRNGHGASPAAPEGNPAPDDKPVPDHEAALRRQVLADARTLNVSLSAEALDAVLACAEQEGLSHLEFLAMIFGAPALRRENRLAVVAATES
jgi:hypothetical protein